MPTGIFLKFGMKELVEERDWDAVAPIFIPDVAAGAQSQR
jgi:hypothetical protein